MLTKLPDPEKHLLYISSILSRWDAGVLFKYPNEVLNRIKPTAESNFLCGQFGGLKQLLGLTYSQRSQINGKFFSCDLAPQLAQVGCADPHIVTTRFRDRLLSI